MRAYTYCTCDVNILYRFQGRLVTEVARCFLLRRARRGVFYYAEHGLILSIHYIYTSEIYILRIYSIYIYARDGCFYCLLLFLFLKKTALIIRSRLNITVFNLEKSENLSTVCDLCSFFCENSNFYDSTSEQSRLQ